MWCSQSKDQLQACMISNMDETKLWLIKFDHLNLKSMRNITSENGITGLPNLNIEEGKIYRDFQISKQTKMSYKKIQHLNTYRLLELLHMDVMRIMQV